MAKRTKAEQERIEQAVTNLREMLKQGQTVYTYLASVSRSGMSREIGVLIPSTNSSGEPTVRNISGWVADALDWKWTDRGAVKVGGAGMDMGFHLVYVLSSKLFDGDGYALHHRWV